MSQSLFSDVDNSWHESFHNLDLNADPAGSPVKDGEGNPLDEETNSQTDVGQQVTNALLTPGERLHLAAVKVHAAVKFTRLQRLKRRACWATKKLIVFVLSQVGLTCLVVLYAIAGGFIFMALEGNPSLGNGTSPGRVNDLHNHTDMFNLSVQRLGSHYADLLWNNTVSYNVLYPDSWKRDTRHHLEDMAREVYNMVLSDLEDLEISDLEWTASSDDPRGWEPRYRRGSQKSETVTEWTYPRALLFAITIITTIGYGNTVPLTVAAKVVCMVYAMFGIPMTLLCLANIGSLMATVYRFTWKHISHLALVIIRSPKRNTPVLETSQVRVPVVVSLATMVGYILGGAAIFSAWEGWSYVDGSYFCFITLSTIGFGDFVPGQNRETFESNSKRVVCALYLLFGLALLSMVFQLIQDSALVLVSRYASLLGLSQSKIDKGIQDCVDSSDNHQGHYVHEVSPHLSRCPAEMDTDKTIPYPTPEARLSGEHFHRFLDVARHKMTQKTTASVSEGKSQQLKATCKLDPAPGEGTGQ